MSAILLGAKQRFNNKREIPAHRKSTKCSLLAICNFYGACCLHEKLDHCSFSYVINVRTARMLANARKDHSIPLELYAFLVVTETAVSVISCISCVDSSPNLFCFLLFLIQILVDEAWDKTFHRKQICCINFHKRSNAGIMAGNRDTVNQTESENCFI